MNIVFKGKDGSVAIMTIVDGANELEAIRKFLECHPGKYEKKFFKDVKLPEDKTHRDRWSIDAHGKIIIKPEK